MEATRYFPLYVTWKCSHCGRIATDTHIVRETVTVTNNEAVVWYSSTQHPPDTNQKPAVQSGRKIQKIFEERDRGRYRLAEFDCQCNHCGDEEPWSKMRYYKYDVIFGALLPLAILLTIFYPSFGFWLLITEAIYFLTKFIHRQSIEQQLQQLPKLSHPCIALTPEESLAEFQSKLNQELALSFASSVNKT